MVREYLGTLCFSAQYCCEPKSLKDKVYQKQCRVCDRRSLKSSGVTAMQHGHWASACRWHQVRFLFTGLQQAQVAALRAHVRDQALGARRPHSQKGLEWTVMQRKTGTELPASSQDFSGLSQMSLKNITHTGVPCQPGGVGWGGRWEGGSKGRGYMHTYSWFILRSDRKPQNSVKATILQFFKKLLFPLYYFSSPVFLKCWKKEGLL